MLDLVGDLRTMAKLRKITVKVPAELLEKAQEASSQGEMNYPSLDLKPSCGERVCFLFLREGRVFFNESFN